MPKAFIPCGCRRQLPRANAEGIDPILVTWALAKDIRLLAAVSVKRDSADFALKQAGVWQNRLPLYKACLARHNTKRFNRLLQYCARVDGITKGQQQGNVWDELQSLSFMLAGGR